MLLYILLISFCYLLFFPRKNWPPTLKFDKKIKFMYVYMYVYTLPNNPFTGAIISASAILFYPFGEKNNVC